MKYDDFEKKHYIEMQKYKYFNKENFTGVEKFTQIAYTILKLVLILFALFCILVTIFGIVAFLSMTVLNQRPIFSF